MRYRRALDTFYPVQLGAELPEGLYAETGSAQDDAGKLWSDRVSDFDQLSPAMQRTFGAELCEYLRDFHQAPSHCDYPFHHREIENLKRKKH